MVERETNLLGTLNERNISQLASHCYLPQETDSIVCTGKTDFLLLGILNLFPTKFLNKLIMHKYLESFRLFSYIFKPNDK